MQIVENISEVRAFHPKVLAELPLDVILELKQVGLDLASGKIPREDFQMKSFHCDTAHCIAGWVSARMRKSHLDLFYGGKSPTRGYGPAGVSFIGRARTPLGHLFDPCNPNNRRLAAKAIEQYLYNYAPKPWAAAEAMA